MSLIPWQATCGGRRAGRAGLRGQGNQESGILRAFGNKRGHEKLYSVNAMIAWIILLRECAVGDCTPVNKQRSCGGSVVKAI